MSFIIRRIVTGMITIFSVTLISFFVFNLIPGDTARIILGFDADETAVSNLREELGLNSPLSVRYFDWFLDVLRGDLGDSIGYKQPVTDIIADTVSPTISITIFSLIISMLLSLPLGILAALKHNKKSDILITSVSQIGVVIPSFWLGIILLLIFSQNLKLFPYGSYTDITENFSDWLKSIFLPSLSLGLISSAVLTRVIRSSVLENMKEDFIRTAKSKGLKESRIIYKHVLKNSLTPILTVTGLQIASILAGTIIIENVFSIPGMGRLLLYSVQRRDLPVVQGVVLWIAMITVIVNIAVDILQIAIDPRLRS